MFKRYEQTISIKYGWVNLIKFALIIFGVGHVRQQVVGNIIMFK